MEKERYRSVHKAQVVPDLQERSQPQPAFHIPPAALPTIGDEEKKNSTLCE